VVVTGRRVNHVLHLLLALVTDGLWLIPWAVISATGGERSQTLRIDERGTVSVNVSDVTRTTGSVRWFRVAAFGIAVLGAVLALSSLTGQLPMPLLGSGLVLTFGGLALAALDIRRYGTGRVVSVTKELDRR
jgi:hypothetical protein